MSDRTSPGIVRPASVADAAAIARIYNQGIADRIATFETRLRDADEIAGQITTLPPNHAMLVAVAGETVIGWAGYGTYRSRPCYRGVGEYSVYVDRQWRGHGVGGQLLEALIDAARERGCWKLLSRIFPTNEASIVLAERLGFRRVGVYRRHAQLDGVWLDVVIVERLIPENQPEGPSAKEA
jgi:phosphinothricin acetyltransferase